MIALTPIIPRMLRIRSHPMGEGTALLCVAPSSTLAGERPGDEVNNVRA